MSPTLGGFIFLGEDSEVIILSMVWVKEFFEVLDGSVSEEVRGVEADASFRVEGEGAVAFPDGGWSAVFEEGLEELVHI